MTVGSDSELFTEYKKVGTARRIVKETGAQYYLWVPVVYSESEDRYHRVLPDTLIPFKHYTAETIADAANNDKDLDDYEISSSDSSRLRWKKEIRTLLIRRKAETPSCESLPSTHIFSAEEVADLLAPPLLKRL